MIVTELVPYGRTKCKVYVDYEYAFCLTNREIRLYEIEKEHSITDALFSEILKDIVIPKAKLKAMDLLKSMDRTEYELCSKLKQAGYAEMIVQVALDYVKQYNYVNDYRYACNYINYRKTMKSMKMITMELGKKGISKEMIADAMEEEYQVDHEEESIMREIKKKCKNVEELTYEKKAKLYTYLYRKGYSQSLIRKALGSFELYEV